MVVCVYQAGESVNGWLSPTGEFLPCLIGHHHETALEIIEDYRKTWEHTPWIQITPDSAFSDKCPTQAQVDWLMKSRNRFYKQDVKTMLEKYGEKKKAPPTSR